MQKSEYDLGLRRVPSAMYPSQIYDIFAKTVYNSDDRRYQQRSAIGRIAEDKVLQSKSAQNETAVKIYGIFSIDLTQDIRFIYHSEIDCGPNCAGNGIEFKTKTFFADEKHKAVNFLESRITYSNKLKEIYCKAYLSRLNTAVFALVEEQTDPYGPSNFDIKNMRFYDTAMTASTAEEDLGVWTEAEIQHELENFGEFLKSLQFIQATSNLKKKLFEIVGKKFNRGRTSITISSPT
ncbi:hypothetical protein Fcan01_23993 [Folsomia candida]|uniref:Uncharacterized protein n=1 Tax=Folsomia candida TaxID=158441 RepID=A0A226D7D6_FOLCA|nr:hypothetical protein Fcan01_23993 [Folsomia candida]